MHVSNTRLQTLNNNQSSISISLFLGKLHRGAIKQTLVLMTFVTKHHRVTITELDCFSINITHPTISMISLSRRVRRDVHTLSQFTDHRNLLIPLRYAANATKRRRVLTPHVIYKHNEYELTSITFEKLYREFSTAKKIEIEKIWGGGKGKRSNEIRAAL